MGQWAASDSGSPTARRHMSKLALDTALEVAAFHPIIGPKSFADIALQLDWQLCHSI